MIAAHCLPAATRERRNIPVRLPLLAVAGTLGAHLVAVASFRQRVEALAGRLVSPADGTVAKQDIPDLLRSFAQRAVPGATVPVTVRLRQRAEMRANPGDHWQPHAAEQVIGVRAPGFVWLARMRLSWPLPVQVLDSYVDGNGRVEVRLFGSLRLAGATGPQVCRGELMRYLAELAWVPHAMLHNPGLSWREVDATTVEVSAEGADGPARIRLVFEDGDIVRVEADDRPRAVAGGTVPTAWRGSFSDYRQIGGCRIPARAEAGWLLSTGPFVCWQGK